MIRNSEKGGTGSALIFDGGGRTVASPSGAENGKCDFVESRKPIPVQMGLDELDANEVTIEAGN
jgi:hypothetical protein